MRHISVRDGDTLRTQSVMKNTAKTKKKGNTASSKAKAAQADEDFLEGPQLPGDAISQDDVDALLAGFE